MGGGEASGWGAETAAGEGAVVEAIRRLRSVGVVFLLALGCGGRAADVDASSGDALLVHPDVVRVIEVVGREPGAGWSDSYSVGSACFCESTFDHGIGEVVVETPVGARTVRDVCEAIGPGPGSAGRPLYNDVQCGNGPANDAGDETDCPGRVDIGRQGCGHIGPRWDLAVLAE